MKVSREVWAKTLRLGLSSEELCADNNRAIELRIAKRGLNMH
jgi:hypothetical protein